MPAAECSHIIRQRLCVGGRDRVDEHETIVNAQESVG
jgi:hypothetical protein